MMRSERFWVVCLALVSFLAGGAGGILWAMDRVPVREARPWSGYVAQLSQEFDLSSEQREDLRKILKLYHDGVEELKVRQMGGAEPELIKLGRTCRDRIRKWVLARPEDRARFDELSGNDATLVTL